MKLNSNDVRDIALEARLILSDDELPGAVAYINDFLDMLDRFKELDLKNVEPFAFAEVVACPLREDELKPFKNTGAIIKASEHVVNVSGGEYFKVPRIMGEQQA